MFNYTVTHESKIRASEKQFASLTRTVRDEDRHDPAGASVPPYYPDTKVVRRDLARFADLVTALDRQVGDLLKELEEDGLAENTIVFFFSDHGTGLPRAKRWIYDSGIHVPLIVRVPERYSDLAPGPVGTATDRLVSFVDFAPTVLSLAGLKPAAHVQGRAFLGDHAGDPREYVYAIRDRMDERYDFIRGVRDRRFKYLRNYMPHLPYSQNIDYMNQMPTMRELRRLAAAGDLEGARASFMRTRKPVEELYDTEADPHEVKNLAGSPKHSEILARMRAELARWQTATRDLGFIPEADLNARTGDLVPYDWARSGEYPLGKLRDAADAALLNPSEARLLAQLGDPDPAVRYWGALGCDAESLSTEALSVEVGRALQMGLDDSSAAVRMTCAGILARQGDDDAVDLLIEALESANEWEALQAALALDRLKRRSESTDDAMQAVLSGSKRKYVVRVLAHALKGNSP